MKIKNKIFILLGVFTLVGLSHSLTLKDLNASLTAPASYNINYRYDSVNDDTFKLGASSLGTFAPFYTRTTDSTYYNYSTTIDNSDSSILPLGLEITMTFNRSNTSWFLSSGNYYPDENKIGSTNAVGSKIGKVDLVFDNQTNKNYRLYIDTTSMTQVFTNYYVNDILWDSDTYYLNTTFSNILIPTYTKIRLQLPETSGARYFDAWYLQDLGVSDSYDAGFDAGSIYANENADLLVTGFTAMVGILVNFVLMIVNLEVLGVSILGVFSIILLFTTIVWVLKLIRG
jgi:hypothetical protein